MGNVEAISDCKTIRYIDASVVLASHCGPSQLEHRGVSGLARLTIRGVIMEFFLETNLGLHPHLALASN